MFPWAKSLNLLGASVSLLTNEDNDARLPHLAGLNEAGSGKVRSRQSPRNLSAVAVGSAPSSPSSCLEQLPPVSPPYLQALPLPLCTSETHPSAPHHPSPGFTFLPTTPPPHAQTSSPWTLPAAPFLQAPPRSLLSAFQPSLFPFLSCPPPPLKPVTGFLHSCCLPHFQLLLGPYPAQVTPGHTESHISCSSLPS